jgi:photosystem II stability/assembly factor-like uncharacterized protein
MLPESRGLVLKIFIVAILALVAFRSDLNSQWVKQSPIPTDKMLRDICFIKQDTGWVFGDAGSVFRTNDGGDTWIDQSIDTYFEVFQGVFLDSETGWIAVSSYQQDAWGHIIKQKLEGIYGTCSTLTNILPLLTCPL